MQEKECMIIRDLLPSYVEQLTGEGTAGVIDAHLKECKKCQGIYQELVFQYAEENRRQGKVDKKFLGKLRRYRYQLIGGLIGIMIPVLVVVIWFGSLILKNRFTTPSVESTQNVEEYRKFENYYGLSPLDLFPTDEQVAENGGEIVEYVYECNDNKMYQNCQIYMECQYTEEGFEKEASRLKTMRHEDSGQTVCTSEELFAYPGVYAMLSFDSCNEYALLLEEESKIIYIYLQGMVDRRDLYFDEKYLPLDYGQNGFEMQEIGEFNMYPAEWYTF